MSSEFSSAEIEHTVGQSLECTLKKSVLDPAPVPLRTAMGNVTTANPSLRMPPAQLAEAILRAAAAVGLSLTVPRHG